MKHDDSKMKSEVFLRCDRRTPDGSPPYGGGVVGEASPSLNREGWGGSLKFDFGFF